MTDGRVSPPNWGADQVDGAADGRQLVRLPSVWRWGACPGPSPGGTELQLAEDARPVDLLVPGRELTLQCPCGQSRVACFVSVVFVPEVAAALSIRQLRQTLRCSACGGSRGVAEIQLYDRRRSPGSAYRESEA